MENQWNLLITPPAPGSWNMAVDQYLMESGENWLRLYQWEKPTLSLGYFQKMEEIVEEPILSGKADLVRRLTGGKAVLHNYEVTYSVTADSDDFPGALKESYKTIGNALTAGLEELGVKSRLVEREPQKLEDGNCFKVPGWYEVIFQDKKLIGSAQTRKKGRLLQHGSLLTDCNRSLLNSLFPAPEEQDASLITLKEILNNTPSTEEIETALIKGFKTSWDIEFIPKELNQAAHQRVKKIEMRYLDIKWTKAR